MKHLLPELPYNITDLEPYISRQTIEYHYGKHHKAYINNLNQLIQGTEFQDLSLGEVVMQSKDGIFNNAAQVWNHNLYWKCLHPDGGSLNPGLLKDAIKHRFGSFEKFKNEFTTSAITNFGSGWTWLTKDSFGHLEIINTKNADTPMVNGLTALLTMDVWEHAYYVDYRNARPDYINSLWEIINWDFVENNFKNGS